MKFQKERVVVSQISKMMDKNQELQTIIFSMKHIEIPQVINLYRFYRLSNLS